MNILHPQWHRLPSDDAIHGAPRTLAEHGIENITVLGRQDGPKGVILDGLLETLGKPAAEQGFNLQVVYTDPDRETTINQVRAANRGREVLFAVGGDGIVATAMQATRSTDMVVHGVAGGKTNDAVRVFSDNEMLLHPKIVLTKPVLLRKVTPLQATLWTKQRSTNPADGGALQTIEEIIEADQYLGIGFSADIARIMDSDSHRNHPLQKVLGHYALDRIVTFGRSLPGILRSFSVSVDGRPARRVVDEQFLNIGSMGGSFRPDASPDEPYGRYIESASCTEAYITSANLALGRSVGDLISSAKVLEITADHDLYGQAGGEIFPIDTSHGPATIEVAKSSASSTVVTKPGPLTQTSAKQYRP